MGRGWEGWGGDRQRNWQVNAQALSKLPFSELPFSFFCEKSKQFTDELLRAGRRQFLGGKFADVWADIQADVRGRKPSYHCSEGRKISRGNKRAVSQKGGLGECTRVPVFHSGGTCQRTLVSVSFRGSIRMYPCSGFRSGGIRIFLRLFGVLGRASRLLQH